MDMTHSMAQHDSFMYVTCLVHVNMTHCECESPLLSLGGHFYVYMTHSMAQHDSFVYVTCRVHVYHVNMTHFECESPLVSLGGRCCVDMTHSFMYVTCLVHACHTYERVMSHICMHVTHMNAYMRYEHDLSVKRRASPPSSLCGRFCVWGHDSSNCAARLLYVTCLLYVCDVNMTYL